MLRVLNPLFMFAVCCVALSIPPTRLHAQDTAAEKKEGTQNQPSARNEGLPQGIIDDLGNWRIWVVLLIAFAFGFMGSYAYERAEAWAPTATPAPADSAALPAPRGALWARVWLGGFAAVAVLYPLRPEGLISLVSLSVIAGSMGTALFKILHDRVLQLARTARLGAALAANESMLRDIHKTAQGGSRIGQDFQF